MRSLQINLHQLCKNFQFVLNKRNADKIDTNNKKKVPRDI